MVEARSAAEVAGVPMLEEGPLDHWIQCYEQHGQNEPLDDVGASDATDSAILSKSKKKDPCWLGLQRLHQFLVVERPALLFDLNQQQQQYHSRERAVHVLDSLTTVTVKTDRTEETGVTSRPAADVQQLRGHRGKLHDALLFYKSKVSVEYRSSTLASFQEFLATLESTEVSASDEGSTVQKNTSADVLAFLMHLESFLLQAINEQEWRREHDQHGAPSSASILPEESDDPAVSTLQDWVQCVNACASALSDSLPSTNLPLGTRAWMKGDNEGLLLRLGQSTAERASIIEESVQRHRDRTIADRDAARQRYADVEERWNKRAQDMSKLRRDVEQHLTTALLGGGTANPTLPAGPAVGSADSDPMDDVDSTPIVQRVSVRISDEPLQSTTS